MSVEPSISIYEITEEKGWSINDHKFSKETTEDLDEADSVELTISRTSGKIVKTYTFSYIDDYHLSVEGTCKKADASEKKF